MQHTIKGYVVHQTWKGEREGEFRFQPYPAVKNSAHSVQVPVCEHELSFELPDDFDPRPGQIEALRAEQQKVRAEMAARIKELDDQINSLLALEMA